MRNPLCAGPSTAWQWAPNDENSVFRARDHCGSRRSEKAACIASAAEEDGQTATDAPKLSVVRSETIGVMVVEDDPAANRRFCEIIENDARVRLVGTYGCGRSAVDALRSLSPDILLVDLGLPDLSGIEVIKAALREHPKIDVMVVTVFGDEEHVLASIEAGATGYLLKDSLPHEFVEVIHDLRSGGSPISPIIARRLLVKLRPSTRASAEDPETRVLLSARETEILTLLAKGFSFCEIARLLEISTHTVTAHVKKIYQKLAVHSRGEAVFEAGRMGLIH